MNKKTVRLKITFFAKVAIYFAMTSVVLGIICSLLQWWGIALVMFCVNNTFFCGYLLSRTNWMKRETNYEK